MKRGKILYDTILDKYKYGNTKNDVHLCAYGLFDTEKAQWKYYIISYADTTGTGNNRLVEDVANKRLQETMPFSIYNIENFYNSKPTLEECSKYIEDFKIKWETGSNSSTQEQRDKKLKEILD